MSQKEATGQDWSRSRGKGGRESPHLSVAGYCPHRAQSLSSCWKVTAARRLVIGDCCVVFVDHEGSGYGYVEDKCDLVGSVLRQESLMGRR